MIDLDTLLETAKDGVEKIGREFTLPDDDWQTVMFVLGDDRQLTIVALMLENTPQQALAMALAMQSQKAQAIVLVQSAWTMRTDPHVPRPVDLRTGEPLQIKDTPGRAEDLTLLAADRDGRMEMHRARINRFTDKPPTLEPWECFDTGMVDGRLPDAVRAGFR